MSRTDYIFDTQVTFAPKEHCLDNCDNFSACGEFLCYDTRDGSTGPGVESSTQVEKVELCSGTVTTLLEYKDAIVDRDTTSAPGIGAPSFGYAGSDRVAIIHGPPLSAVDEIGFYGKANRRGCELLADGSGEGRWLDKRVVPPSPDVLTSTFFTEEEWFAERGTHRGGTHRHEYCRDGTRVGCTYDDNLLPEYGRTIAYLEYGSHAPSGVCCSFAILVPVTKHGESKEGEIEVAAGDSWVGSTGEMRAFIGKVRESKFKEKQYEESLFVCDIPKSVDITTASSGSRTEFPTPPQGVVVRRLTHSWAGGIVRGSPSGKMIAYYGKDVDGVKQIFIIPSDGSDESSDTDKQPQQVTYLSEGVKSLRWQSENVLAFISGTNDVMLACAKPGSDFGRMLRCRHLPIRYMAPPKMDVIRNNLAVSPDGSMLAYNSAPFTRNQQIYVMACPPMGGWTQGILNFEPKQWALEENGAIAAIPYCGNGGNILNLNAMEASPPLQKTTDQLGLKTRTAKHKVGIVCSVVASIALMVFSKK
ncbi:hypothetical protein CYMTET_47786 [Cymbomonas tetramitiformis]|uniref:Uncharacterized protein n=1 Tax=Cymbomonas tetramitiformis TaxID=36881 RepID=A0AAE0EVM0_9CHLO|nr:hypothetical protein CYMTET_47786 [Cymbomonas tetramitiformis]